MLSACPDPLPQNLDRSLRRLASLWAKHPLRPRIKRAVAAYWDRLIASWIIDEKLPLLVRKSERGVAKGEIIIHESGRQLVPTDNSPASWSYLSAISDVRPSIADIRRALEQDKIPVAMVVDREMAARSRYKCSRVSGPSPNSLGWKVCHKREVRLRGRGPLKHRRLADLQEHFQDFLAPSNMFLVPLSLGGLGEIPQFIEAIAREPHGL